MNGVMQPFERATLACDTFDEFLQKHSAAARKAGVTVEELRVIYADMLMQEIWKNDQYQVNLDKNPEHGFVGNTLWHLSIKRLDKAPVHDWRDLHKIKNLLCGAEAEAIELYPAESRLVDTANQYHLFVFADGAPVPCGWTKRMVSDDTAGTNAVQRPFA